MSNIADVEMLSGRFQLVGSEISMALYAAILRAEAAEQKIVKLERHLGETECELAHAYWASCGCLAGEMGHEDGSDGCAFPSKGGSE